MNKISRAPAQQLRHNRRVVAAWALAFLADGVALLVTLNMAFLWIGMAAFSALIGYSNRHSFMASDQEPQASGSANAGGHGLTDEQWDSRWRSFTAPSSARERTSV